MPWTAKLSLVLRVLGYIWCAIGSLILLKLLYFFVSTYDAKDFISLYMPVLVTLYVASFALGPGAFLIMVANCISERMK